MPLFSYTRFSFTQVALSLLPQSLCFPLLAQLSSALAAHQQPINLIVSEIEIQLSSLPNLRSSPTLRDASFSALPACLPPLLSFHRDTIRRLISAALCATAEIARTMVKPMMVCGLETECGLETCSEPDSDGQPVHECMAYVRCSECMRAWHRGVAGRA